MYELATTAIYVVGFTLLMIVVTGMGEWLMKKYPNKSYKIVSKLFGEELAQEIFEDD